MRQLKGGRAAFTLIELLIVVIIVAILAAAGVPLLSANVDRARATEAETALGAIRTAVRAYGVEFNAYPAAPTTTGTGMTVADLKGHFYNSAAFTVSASDFAAKTFCIDADGSASTAPGKSKVAALDRSMNESGTIWDQTGCTGTQLN